MKLSAQSVFFIVVAVNLFVGGMSWMESIDQSTEESDRMLSNPIDFRCRLPSAPPADPTVGAKTGSAVVANAGREVRSE